MRFKLDTAKAAKQKADDAKSSPNAKGSGRRSSLTGRQSPTTPTTPTGGAAASNAASGSTRDGDVLWKTAKKKVAKAAAAPLLSSAALTAIGAALLAQATEMETKVEAAKTLPVLVGEALLLKETNIPQLVKSWAKNGEDPITKMEFRQHIRKMIDKPDTKSIDDLFASLDGNTSASIELADLKTSLKKLTEKAVRNKRDAKGARTRIDLLRERGIQANETAATTATWEQANEEIDAIQKNKGIEARLGTLLAQKASSMKISDIIQKWDTSGDGVISKEEFRSNVKKLGLVAANIEIDGLFDQLDDDGGGTLDQQEIKKAFRNLLEMASKSDKRIKVLQKSIAGDLASTRGAQSAFRKSQQADVERDEAEKEEARSREQEKAAAAQAAKAAKAKAAEEKAAAEAAKKAEYDARLAQKRQGTAFAGAPASAA